MIRPRWEGLGWSIVIMGVALTSYYSVIVAWILIYLWDSLKDLLPWLTEVAELFFTNRVLNVWEDPNDKPNVPGPISSDQAIALAVFWILTFLFLGFGRQVLSKVTYVTVLMPMIFMTTMTARTAFLDGAWDGIAFEPKYLLS